MSSRRSKEKPFGLAKACKSAQLPSSTSTTKEGCNCDVVLSKTTKTSMSSTPVGRGEECSNKKSSNSGKCAGLVKATKTAKFPLVDEGPLVYEKEEPLSVEDKVYEVDSCLDHQLNEKSSLRRMLTEVATSSLQRTSPSSKREESKDENKSKKCSRLPPRGGGMVQKGCSRGGRVAASVVKGTRTAIIPFCEQPSVIVNTDNMDSSSSFCCSEDEDNGQKFSWQETAIRLPVPEEYNDDRSAYSSGKNQTFLSGGRCPSAVKFHTVEKFFAEGKEKGVRSCCISAALREQMLRSRKGGCSIVKESLAEKTQSSSEKLRLRSRSESPGKIPKGKNVEDVQAGTQRIYGLEVVGQIFQVLLDGKELWTAHNNTTNKKEKK